MQFILTWLQHLDSLCHCSSCFLTCTVHTHRGGQCVSLTLSVSDLLTFFISRMFYKAKKPKPDSHFRFFPTYKFTRDSVFTAAEKLHVRVLLMTEFVKTTKTNVMVNDIDTNQVIKELYKEAFTLNKRVCVSLSESVGPSQSRPNR